MNLQELGDADFVRKWRGMSDFEKIEYSAADVQFFDERYANLQGEPIIKQGMPLPKRANGHSDPFDPGEVPQEGAPTSNLIDWPALTGEPPPFAWIIDHWLSWHPTLLAGRGGIGKSLLVQQLLTSLACGLPTWGAASEPLNVLYWACEDDVDQLWRRQTAICKQLKIPFSDLGRMHVDARSGLENTLLATDFGKPSWTAKIELLRQQVNDLNIEVLALDNLGHTFGGNENNRHDVTVFLNGIAGLVTGRKFCPILLGHPSKAIGSDYSGSTAWENAVRMRWYLDDKMPDAKPDEDAPPDRDYRVLAKRKANYTVKDYVGMRFQDGVLVADIQHESDPGLMATLRKRKAKSIIVAAITKLAAVETWCNDSLGRNYLPTVLLQNKLADGLTKAELADAMRAMILSGELTRDVVGKNAGRKPIYGLKTSIGI